MTRIHHWVCVGVLVGRVVVVLAVAEVALLTSTLPRTCRLLAVRHDLDSRADPARVAAVLPRPTRTRVRVAYAVTRRWPWGDTCLRQCLVLGNLLRAQGPVMRIGLQRRPDGTLLAHSWLEIEGRTLDPTSRDFAALRGMGL